MDDGNSTVIVPTNPFADNPNSNSNLSTMGMVETLGINLVVFALLILVFEYNRFYKQIYLKRLQNRFQAVNRVPPYPDEGWFGWFFEINKVKETDILQMVGLDAYMCLRYIVICFKYAVFLSFWGLVVLVPSYATAGYSSKWDRYSISNLLVGDESMKYRLWLSAVFGYIFAAYFCQLLYAEYNNFSVRRLQYLVQSEDSNGTADPDTPPQKYFTVMIERIPGHLRSAEQLFKFFEKLFPGDVYTVEIALDLTELDKKCKQRKAVRQKLEKAIARYEAKNERLKVKIHTGECTNVMNTAGGIFDGDGILQFLRKAVAPERYGFQDLDAIHYYTTKLQELNEEVKELQFKNYEKIRNTDAKLLHKMKNKHDTRIAAFFEKVQEEGAKTVKELAEKMDELHEEFNSGGLMADGDGTEAAISNANRPALKPSRFSMESLNSAGDNSDGDQSPHTPHAPLTLWERMKKVKFDELLFGEESSGGPSVDLKLALKMEMAKLKHSTENMERDFEEGGAGQMYNNYPGDFDPSLQTDATNLASMTPKQASSSSSSPSAAQGLGIGTPHDDEYRGSMLLSRRNDRETITRAAALSVDAMHQKDLREALAQEPTVKEWIRTADVDFQKEEVELQQRQREYKESELQRQQQALRASTELELKAYMQQNKRRPTNPFAPSTATKLAAVDEQPSEDAAQSGVDESDSCTNQPKVRSRSGSFTKTGVPRNAANDFIDNLGDMRRTNRSNAAAAAAALIASGGANASAGSATPSVSIGIADVNTNTKGLTGKKRSGSTHTARKGDYASLNELSEEDCIVDADFAEVERQKPSVMRKLFGNIQNATSSYFPSNSNNSITVPEGATTTPPVYPSPTPPKNETEADLLHPMPSSLPPTSRSRSSTLNSTSSSSLPPLVPKPRPATPTVTTGTTTTAAATEVAQVVPQEEKPVGVSRARRDSTQAQNNNNNNNVIRFGGTANPLAGMLTDDQLENMDKLTREGFQKAKTVSKEGWQQTKLAGSGALKASIEIERAFEMLLVGAYYKYSSTAFVTFNTRVTESIAQQMLLSHDIMEINHAPNPHDIIWDNVAIPKSQIRMRHYITNIAVIVGSIFWSSIVNNVYGFARFLPLPKGQQQLAAAVVMLVFLLVLPFVFDFLARNYEGLKLESEIQNSIMTRYFYYQLINVYVTVGFSGGNLWMQIFETLQKPQTLVDMIGGRMPDVSIFFTKIMIVKALSAVPLEMIRPWQLLTILYMGKLMDRRETTRRDLRTGAFYSWPMLYGWIYPQIMMGLMIMVTYSCITPLMMPFCALFFAGAYVMYKYQLLYVYINDYQSGGYMWYAVFNRSLICLGFASVTLLGYLSLQLADDANMAGPFFFLLPLPFCIVYFAHYCELKFKKASMNLSYGFAKELDHRNAERKAAGKPIPHNTFTKTLYRQPSLTEKEVYPEPYRNDGTYDILRSAETGESVLMSDWRDFRTRRGSLSINVHELTDEGEEDQRVLEEYFREVVLPLSVVPPSPESSTHGIGGSDGSDGDRSEHGHGHGQGKDRRDSGKSNTSAESTIPFRTRERR